MIRGAIHAGFLLIGAGMSAQAQSDVPTNLDLRILRRAGELLVDRAVWNRADTRECLADQTKISLFCALYRASVEIAGDYEHRRLALEEVRKTLDPLLEGKQIEHRLRDFNNDPDTSFADIQRVLDVTIARLSAKLPDPPASKGVLKFPGYVIADGWRALLMDHSGDDHTLGKRRAQVVSDMAHSGQRSILLRTDQPTEQVGILQLVQSGPYRGKRIRFSGYLKTELEKGTAVFTFQADDGKGNRLVFDHMLGRQVRGATPWTRYQIVIDIPETAVFFEFGAGMTGVGSVWVDDLRVEIVAATVALTTQDSGRTTIAGLKERNNRQRAAIDEATTRTLPEPTNLGSNGRSSPLRGAIDRKTGHLSGFQ